MRLILLVLLSGCAHYQANQRLEKVVDCLNWCVDTYTDAMDQSRCANLCEGHPINWAGQ